MKKILLVVTIFSLLTSCNFKPGGNKGIIEETHEPSKAEQMHSKNHNTEHRSEH